MRINNLYNSNISENLKIGDGADVVANLQPGDILEGLVTQTGESAKIKFEQLNNKEITFDSASVKNAYVGEKRRFEVVEAGTEKLVLKDITAGNTDMPARAVTFTKVDASMPQLVEDFAETNGSREKDDDDPIRKLSDEDYRELRTEGFSIEDFKAERLARAIIRVKKNRAAKQENLEKNAEKLQENRQNIRKQAVRNAADKYSANRIAVEKLEEADLPITQENVARLMSAMNMSAGATAMSDNSFAYMIKNELEPSIRNIYKSVYSGSINRRPIADNDWKQLEPAAAEVVRSAANSETPASSDDVRRSAPGMYDAAGSESGASLYVTRDISVEDAKWLLEYDLPLTAENLVYKKQLEQLQSNGFSAEDAARAAASALAQGKEAQDGLLIEDRTIRKTERPVAESVALLKLNEIRLSMMLKDSGKAGYFGHDINEEAEHVRNVINELKRSISTFYRELAEETEFTPEETELDIAVRTAGAVENVSEAPISFYRETFALADSLTLAQMDDTAATLRSRISAAMPASGTETAQNVSVQSITVKAFASYEASATEIRNDLGDSITKAFRNVDSLIIENGLEVTEANRRAVRILGYNSMEINGQNIERMKYYDAKLTTMIEGMKPATVMTMIKQGFNPLDRTIDEINARIDEIADSEGISAEERFSTFLVNLEKNASIDEAERSAYIGIYRLLYQIGKNDSAALGAALLSGRKLTMENLLTEARTRRNRGIDELVDDETVMSSSHYTNSITQQLETAFSGFANSANGGTAGQTAEKQSASGQTAEKQSAAGQAAEKQSVAGQTAEKQGVAGQAAEKQSTAGQTGDTFERYGYRMHLAGELSRVTDPEVWEEALKNENPEELTFEQVVEKIKNADNDKQRDFSADAAKIRAVMSAAPSVRKFLKDMGIRDSVRNIRAFTHNTVLSEDEANAGEYEIPSVSTDRETLFEGLTDATSLEALVDKALAEDEKDIEDLLITYEPGANTNDALTVSDADTAQLVRNGGIEERLDRIGLLKEMSGRGHFRFNLEKGKAPAKVNLTIVKSAERAGTISLEVSTSSYHVKADLSLTVYAGQGMVPARPAGRIDGTISCDSVGELEAIKTPLTSFVLAMSSENIDASSVTCGIDKVPQNLYMSRLGEIMRRAARTESRVAGEGQKPSTEGLCNVAKQFLANFL